MIGGIATKALILVVGLGAGLGAGEIGSMYNYDETISDYQKGTRIFDKVQLSSISQEPGKGILVGENKTHFGGWEDNVRVGGRATGGGKVGKNDVDIIFTQNNLVKTDKGNNNGGSSNHNHNTKRTTKGISNRHVCILLGENIVKGGSQTTQQASSTTNQQSSKDTCWNFSEASAKKKSNGEKYYIQATGGNGSQVFLDSTDDPKLGILELDKNNKNKVKRALGRKGWILGLKVNDPKKWCTNYLDRGVQTQWKGNSLNSPHNKKTAANMKNIGFDFLRQSIMVWDEHNDVITSGWEKENQNAKNNQGTRYMEVINCYKV
ncbi:hypothetical protein [Mycoplasma suis]|uniref:Uncharacterized protein n=2 Tax=Mycoplasma suis TaxID=57372 RepID=F0QRX4_MYCSL|nr:hypothetical protein [Mycoplasma suis]ADX98244.1 hypothetical protein MSU_0713 [Mycoplasma suis str. Illinois]CBZ40765.1 hypothetical protein MSUIS_06720 [Mycoplasma suis KI3806]